MPKFNWASKTSIILLMFLAIFLSYQKISQYKLQSSIEKEKQALIKQLSLLDGQNQDLKKTLTYLDSESNKEITARQQLNMQKSGEQVYNFSKIENVQIDNNISTSQINQTNFQKWINYFLNSKNEKSH